MSSMVGEDGGGGKRMKVGGGVYRTVCTVPCYLHCIALRSYITTHQSTSLIHSIMNVTFVDFNQILQLSWTLAHLV